MADDVEVLITELRVDMRRYEAAMRRQARLAEQSAGKVERRYQQMNRRIVSATNDMSRDVRRAISAIALGVGAREVTKYADAWIDLNNKVAAAGQTSGMQGRGIMDLAKQAREARSEIEPYADLYSRILRSANGVAKSEAEVAKVTQITAKAFAAGGAAATEQAAGVLQLGQALGSGFLQGDELRSLRENAPLVAKAIADAMGVSIGQLKKLGAEGKITSQIVFQAMLDAEDSINSAFAVTTPRASTAAVLAFDNLKLKVGEYLQDGGQVQNVSNAMAGAINFVADNVDAFADGLVVAGAALTGALGTQAAVMAVSSLNGIATGATTGAKAMSVLRATSAFLLGPAGLIIGVATLSAGLAYLAINAAKVEPAAGKARDRLSEMRAEMDAINALLPEPFEGAATGAANLADILDPLPQKFRDLKKSMEESGVAAKQLAIDGTTAQMIELTGAISDTEDRLARLQKRMEYAANMPASQGGEALRTRLSAEIERETQLLEEQNATLEEQRKLRSRIFGADSDAFKPPGKTTTGGGGGSDSKDDPIGDVADEYRDLMETAREEAKRVYDEQIAGINAAAAAESAKDEARRQALEIYRAKNAQITAENEQAFNDWLDEEAEKARVVDEQAAREQAIIDDIMNRRDEMAGRSLAIIEREYDARRQAIESEIEDATRKEEALAALDAERSERLAQYRDEILGNGQYSEDAIEQVKATEAAKLAALEEWHQANLDAIQEYEDRKAEIVQESEDKQAEIRAIALSNTLSNASELFGNMSDVVKEFAGEQSGIYKAMFAVSKAFAIADSIVKIQQGIGNALSLPFPANLAAAATVAGQGAAVVASIQQTSANFRDGGIDIRGPGTGRDDRIPAMISNGESVITAAGTAANRGILAAINAGVNVESALGSMRGATSVSIGSTQLFVSGDIGTQETLAALMADLDRRDASLESNVLSIIKSDRAKTTARHRR